MLSIRLRLPSERSIWLEPSYPFDYVAAGQALPDKGRRVGKPRIGVFVVAYNAVSTLASVLERIPSSFRSAIDLVLVSDDFSTDATYEVGLAYEREHVGPPITVFRQRRNLGYGG